MHQEIVCATDFIVKLLGSTLTHPHKDSFRERLAEALAQHCSEHWFPEQPHLGSAYRCVRSEGERCDPLLRNAAEKAGVSLTQLTFPQSFAVWIDPSDVSARIGERGSIFSLQQDGGASPLVNASPSTTGTTSITNDAEPMSRGSPARTPSPLSITSPLGSPRMSHHQPMQQQQQQQQAYHHFQAQQQPQQQPQPQYYHYQQQQQQQQPQIWSHNQRQPLVVYA